MDSLTIVQSLDFDHGQVSMVLPMDYTGLSMDRENGQYTWIFNVTSQWICMFNPNSPWIRMPEVTDQNH